MNSFISKLTISTGGWRGWFCAMALCTVLLLWPRALQAQAQHESPTAQTPSTITAGGFPWNTLVKLTNDTVPGRYRAGINPYILNQNGAHVRFHWTTAGVPLTWWGDYMQMAASVDDPESIACGSADLTQLQTYIYVAPAGNDSDTCGSSSATACASIAQGIDRCSGRQCGVLVAWGRYKLTQTIQLRDGVDLYGGCLPTSKANTTDFSLITAPENGLPAVNADGIWLPTVLQGFQIEATPVTDNTGRPSIAVMVTDSDNLLVWDTKIIASNGGRGADGGNGLPGAAGGNASGRTGGLVVVSPSASLNYCSDSPGGNGGAARHVSVDTNFWGSGTCTPSCEGGDSCFGAEGSPGTTGSWISGGAIGGDECVNCKVTDAGDGTWGNPGINAACGAGGVASSDQSGTFSDSTWSPGAGGSGQAGGNASGGGGGGSGGYHGANCFGGIENTGGQGGGGGAGGCGGQAGQGGQQGGGSFAMVLVHSAISFEETRIIGGIGGTGGTGGAAAAGGAGGQGASGSSGECTAGTCAGTGGTGGEGGIGGSGGGGAGGNGGPAVGIALVNGSTVSGDVVYYTGVPGQAGQPGKGSTTANNCTSL
ncbi:MAG: hypothetical protein H3C34_24820, partial [Caldilineaceae bacterium]|nr:hypothetical protein [Caldilineaceae bacterium]